MKGEKKQLIIIHERTARRMGPSHHGHWIGWNEEQTDSTRNWEREGPPITARHGKMIWRVHRGAAQPQRIHFWWKSKAKGPRWVSCRLLFRRRRKQEMGPACQVEQFPDRTCLSTTQRSEHRRLSLLVPPLMHLILFLLTYFVPTVADPMLFQPPGWDRFGPITAGREVRYRESPF